MLKRIASNPTVQRLISGTHFDPATDHLSDGVKINGTYMTSRNVKITGAVEGDLHVAGTLTVEEHGSVNGDVYAGQDIFVAGRIHGDLRSSGKVLLARTAVISGSIFTRSLGIEQDAVVEGEIHMESDICYSNKRHAMVG